MPRRCKRICVITQESHDQGLQGRAAQSHWCCRLFPTHAVHSGQPRPFTTLRREHRSRCHVAGIACSSCCKDNTLLPLHHFSAISLYKQANLRAPAVAPSAIYTRRWLWGESAHACMCMIHVANPAALSSSVVHTNQRIQHRLCRSKSAQLLQHRRCHANAIAC